MLDQNKTLLTIEIWKKILGDLVVSLSIDVVEELVNILNSSLDFHGLNSLNKFLLLDGWVQGVLITAEDVEDLLIGDLILILDGLDLSASGGKDWVNEATLEEGNIDSLASHVVNEVLVCDLELVFVCTSYVSNDTISLILAKNDLKLVEVSDDAISSNVLHGNNVVNNLVSFLLW